MQANFFTCIVLYKNLKTEQTSKFNMLLQFIYNKNIYVATQKPWAHPPARPFLVYTDIRDRRLIMPHDSKQSTNPVNNLEAIHLREVLKFIANQQPADVVVAADGNITYTTVTVARRLVQ